MAIQMNSGNGRNDYYCRVASDDQSPKKMAALSQGQAAIFIHAWTTQNSLRPLLAAMRIRSALSLMKPAASAWL